jgi:hypothetical protein
MKQPQPVETESKTSRGRLAKHCSCFVCTSADPDELYSDGGLGGSSASSTHAIAVEVV